MRNRLAAYSLPFAPDFRIREQPYAARQLPTDHAQRKMIARSAGAWFCDGKRVLIRPAYGVAVSTVIRSALTWPVSWSVLFPLVSKTV